jgi:hypothetical protein
LKPVLAVACLAVLFACQTADSAGVHSCSSDAVAQAKKFLAFYRRPEEMGFAGQWSVDDAATKIGTVPAIHGKRRYDVLQVWGYIYKARYRMRFIYAAMSGTCVLVGQEIYEDTAL